MKRMLKCSSRWASAMFAATLAIAMAPVSRAQAQSQSETQTVAPGNSTADSSSQSLARRQELEKQVSTPLKQIASLTDADISTTTTNSEDSSSSSSAADPASTPSQDASAPAQTPAPAAAPAAAAAPMPLAMPTMTAPLSTAAPAHTFDGGPFGMLSVTGILSGMGMVQDNWVPGGQIITLGSQQRPDFPPEDDRLVAVLPSGRRVQPARSGSALPFD